MLDASVLNRIKNYKSIFSDEDYMTFWKVVNFVVDTDCEILKSFMCDTYICRAVDIECYNNFIVHDNDSNMDIDLFNEVITYYIKHGFKVKVDTEIDNGDEIRYIIIDWSEVQ